MSDTPRTDANICDHFWNGKEYVEAVTADFARELERERDEAREALKEIEEYGTEEINAAVDLRQKLASERVLADRLGHSIKRLSDLSPLIYAHAMDDLTAWKEARQ